MSEYTAPKFGLATANPFLWKLPPPTKEELAKLRDKERDLFHKRAKRLATMDEKTGFKFSPINARMAAVQIAKNMATRVNPSVENLSSWVPKSTTAPR